MIPKELKIAARRNKQQELPEQLTEANIMNEENSKDDEPGRPLEIIENTPLKRAKEMYQHCIQKAKQKHSASSSRAGIANTNDLSMTINTVKAFVVTPSWNA